MPNNRFAIDFTVKSVIKVGRVRPTSVYWIRRLNHLLAALELS